MFLAMNRFKVRPEQADAFAEMWRQRESRLPEVPGFLGFHLLRGPAADDHVLFASHTMWADRAAFEAWTKSAAFAEGHKRAGETASHLIEGPCFEGFESITETPAPSGGAR